MSVYIYGACISLTFYICLLQKQTSHGLVPNFHDAIYLSIRGFLMEAIRTEIGILTTIINCTYSYLGTWSLYLFLLFGNIASRYVYIFQRLHVYLVCCLF